MNQNRPPSGKNTTRPGAPSGAPSYQNGRPNSVSSQNSRPAAPRQKPRKGRSGLVLVASILVVACVATTLLTVHTIMGKTGTDISDPTANLGGSGSGAAASVSLPPAQPTERRVKFSAVGDNLIHDGIYLQAANRAGGNGYDFSYIYENVKYFFEPFDVNWINQETLVNNELPPASYPMFSTPGPLGQAAYDAGWRVFAMSNNHTYDKGAAGISATMDFWANMPSDVVTPGLFTGNDQNDIKLQEVNGMTIAYLSYTEYTNGLPTPDGAPAWIIYTSETDIIQRQVELARTMADVVIVGVHWGVENSHEVVQGQRTLAASLVSWGADVIIGTHPHVIQPVEWVTDETSGRTALVAYSLGNFISAQAQANQLVGLCLTYELSQTVQPNGEAGPVQVENVKVYPTVTHYDGGYSNIRDYMFRDYTPELAAQHGVHERYPGFGMEYIQGVLESYISPEFLVLD